MFFFDRVSPGALHLARACAERGAIVFFEPSGVGNATLFRQAWEVAHVVKYSHERLSELPETGAFLIVAPIKLEGGSGGPVRVFALLP